MKLFFGLLSLIFIFGTIGEQEKHKSIIFGALAAVTLILTFIAFIIS